MRQRTGERHVKAIARILATTDFSDDEYYLTMAAAARVEELIAAGRSTGDPASRQSAYSEAQAIIWEQAPWVFLVSPDSIAGRAANVSGIAAAPDNTIDARRAAFD